MSLREVSDSDFMSPGHVSGIDRERPIEGIDKPCGMADQRFQKSGFPGTVSSYQGNPFSAVHGSSEVVKHKELPGCAIIRFREPVDLERMSS